MNLGSLPDPTEPLRSARDPHEWVGPKEVLMTKHRTIIGFVAVALRAAAATTFTKLPLSPSTERVVAAAAGNLTSDVSKLPIEEFDDQSVVFTPKR